MSRAFHKISLLFVTLLVLGLGFQPLVSLAQQIDRVGYEEFINNHPYSTRPHLLPGQLKKIPKQDRPDLAWEQNFLMTLDPALGYPPEERLIDAYRYADSIRERMQLFRSAIPGMNWTSRGPNMVGGRTRALMFDPNDASYKKVWAGGVSGGLWYNNDITSTTSVWIKVNDFWDNIAITCIGYDPNNTQVFYAGTGEGFTAGGSSSVRGAGIWKTTDGGQNWTRLSASTGYYYLNDIVVRNENGSSVIYAAVDARYHLGQWHGTPGLYRSTDGGASFTNVIPNINNYPYSVADIEIGADNRIYAGTRRNPNLQGGGTILYSDNGTTWTTVSTYSGISGVSRVELACAPSNANYVYALIEANGKVERIAVSSNKGASWTDVAEPSDADPGIQSTDFSRNQAWYDLILAVDPNDYKTVIAGAIDLFKSVNAGSSWTQLSHWYGGFSLPYVHADQHALVFRPGSSSFLLSGNDGGVFYSDNMGSASPTFTERNAGYVTTQFYSCAINPQSGSDNLLGGTQDNGTHKFTSAGLGSTTLVSGGDGCFCFIDQDNANTQISSYVYNNYYLTNNNWASNTTIANDDNTGRFVNPADFDNRENILYTARSSSTLLRIKNIGTTPDSPDSISINLGSMASALTASPYSTVGNSNLFVGTSAGRLFKITNAHSSSPSATEITGSNFPTAYISCIELGSSENQILVTFSNYGVNSVYESTDGGQNWTSREGNLPDIPVRWAMYYPDNRDWVILATDAGIWSSTQVHTATPQWSPTTGNPGNVRTDMFQYRSADKTVVAATHGRGLFTFQFQAVNTLLADFSSDTVCFGDSTTLTNKSVSSITIDSFLWDIDNDSVFGDYAGKLVKHVFNQPDSHLVGLAVFAGTDADTIYKTVLVYDKPMAMYSVNDSVLCNQDTLKITNQSTIGSNITLSYYWEFGDGDTSTQLSPVHHYSFPNTYMPILQVTASNGCQDTASRTINVITGIQIKFTINDSSQCLFMNSFIFKDNSTACGAHSTSWDLNGDSVFGDDTMQTVSKYFTTADTFTIGLKIKSGADSAILFKQVYLFPQPVAGFSVNDTLQALSKNNFIFTNLSSGAQNYFWRWGDGNTWTGVDTNYRYSIADSFKVKLIAFSNQNCTDTFERWVYVEDDKIGVDFTADSVCVNDSSFIQSTSFYKDSLVSIVWALDNDSIFNDKLMDSVFYLVSSVPGTFPIGLKIITVTDTDSIFKSVTFFPEPVAGFSVAKPVQPLATNFFTFTNASTISSGSLSYLWKLGDGNTSTKHNPQYTYAATGVYDVTLRAESNYQCRDTVHHSVTVIPNPVVVSAAFKATGGCAGDTVYFVNQSTVKYDKLINYFWSYGDGFDAIVKSDHGHVYATAGTYSVRLVAMSRYGFKDTVTQNVEVFDNPVFTLIFDPDTMVFEGSVIKVRPNIVFDSMVWSTGESSAEISISQQGDYWIEVFDANRCSTAKEFSLYFNEVKQIRPTDVFSPNGDGVNDYWIIDNIEAYSPCRVTIYNRYGDKLYETLDYKNDWNGQVNGKPLPQGTYYYILSSDKITLKGSINLVY